LKNTFRSSYSKKKKFGKCISKFLFEGKNRISGRKKSEGKRKILRKKDIIILALFEELQYFNFKGI
jgi:hypothetical protein